MNKPTSSYIPGVCNIGPAERRMRRAWGIFGISTGIILLVYFIVVDAELAWRFLLLAPFTAGALCLLQDAFHFCTAFGLRGIYNVVNSTGVTDNVELEAYRRKDVRKALLIAGLALLVGAFLTGISFLI